jgi:3-deoxy-manno-octulosonate cytidylyltransferase (CMP-KDO synthetase)
MKTYAIIPARYNSTRFPGKPLALINGKPMFQWVYTACSTCTEVDEVVLATDDTRIYDAAYDMGYNVLMTGECQSGTDRVYGAAVYCGLNQDDIVINVQGDEPLIQTDEISILTKHMKDNTRSRMATLATPIIFYKALDSNVVKVVVNHSNNALYFSRSVIPHGGKKYLKHIGIYAYRMATLSLLCVLNQTYLEMSEKLEQLRALDNGITIDVIITSHDTVSVDTPKDIERVKSYLKNTVCNLV